MGTEFRLIRIRTGEAYDLGKAAMRPPVDHWETLVAGLDPVEDHLAWQAAMFPSERAMWRIGTDGGNCAAAVLCERWTAPELAGLVNIACLQEDDRGLAMEIALDLLEWAGTDPVILVPDDADLDRIAQREGIAIAEPVIVRSIHDVTAAGRA